MHIIKERVAKTVPNSKTATHTGLYNGTRLKDNGEIFNTDKYDVYTYFMFLYWGPFWLTPAAHRLWCYPPPPQMLMV